MAWAQIVVDFPAQTEEKTTYNVCTAKSGRPDLNRRPPAPKAGAIPGYATPRSISFIGTLSLKGRKFNYLPFAYHKIYHIAIFLGKSSLKCHIP